MTDRPPPHACVQCSRCGLWSTHTLECVNRKLPPERGHKASTWKTGEPCREPAQGVLEVST